MLLPSLLVPMLPSWLDPQKIVTSAGGWALWAVALIVFAECGLAIFFMPGDSLLFTVGMFIAGGGVAGAPVINFGGNRGLTLVISLAVLMVAAILGNLCGFLIGWVSEDSLFKPRPGVLGKLLDPKHVTQTHAFFARHGASALILARFVPIVRTFVTMVAGVGRMDVKHFMKYTAIGGVSWVLLVTLLGYWLGNISVIRNNIDVALALIVVVSVLPMFIEYLRHRRAAASARSAQSDVQN